MTKPAHDNRPWLNSKFLVLFVLFFSYLRTNNTYEGSWDTFQDLMEPVTANIPYMTLPGNHEVSH